MLMVVNITCSVDLPSESLINYFYQTTTEPPNRNASIKHATLIKLGCFPDSLIIFNIAI